MQVRGRSKCAPRPPVATSQPLVLVVEDEAAVAELIAEALREAGCEPTVAWEGATALRLARELQPALITLDLALPGMSGAAVLRALILDPETRDIPVLIVSGVAANVATPYKHGAIAVISKPVDVDRLAMLARRLTGIADGPQLG